MEDMKPIIYKPTREHIVNLKVNDVVIDCFGTLKLINEIYGRGFDVNGKAYICFYTDFGGTSKMSASYKEGEIVRHTRLTAKYTSAEIDNLEKGK